MILYIHIINTKRYPNLPRACRIWKCIHFRVLMVTLVRRQVVMDSESAESGLSLQ